MAVTYRDAGVDIDAGDELVERIKPLARSTRIAEVAEDVGGFAGLCALPSDIEDPLLVSGTDGVGTKLQIAQATGKHDTIGIDLVAMCVNDIITVGARPLFFLDYFAVGKLDVDVAEKVIAGIADGCRQAGCALIGGETAEHPGTQASSEYDLAGFVVGVVSRRKVLGPKRVKSGDALIGVASSGVHSNGFSLVRRIVKDRGLGYDAVLPELGGGTLGDVLLTPTRIYARTVRELSAALDEDLHALSHITGGGIVGNLPRVLPEGTVAKLRPGWPEPAVFDFLRKSGPVAEDEMRLTFNCGIGLVAVVAAGAEQRCIAALEKAGERAFVLGSVESDAAGGEARVEIGG
ncbi:MAG TPA: phosphoribosylformylglycinamidine cyclo-ligase [Polyangiaceae bacterium]|nr:phosphoribosylformylglycinamidine cyclo-ligase [Polyangiaceae bacterium]